jgi:AcrR family transcriptional regulator
MPTRRFLNLKEEKRQAILEAAVHEFSRVPYASASINQIIKEADISRGSFYTYFEDKDDLMRYLLRGLGEQCQEMILKEIEEEKGNIFAVPVKLLARFMESDTDGLGYKMYQNMLSEMDLSRQNQMFGVQGFLFQDDTYMEFVNKVYEKMDRKRFPVTRVTLAYVLEMAVMLAVKTVTLFYKKTAAKEELLTVAANEMKILECGACNLERHPVS